MYERLLKQEGFDYVSVSTREDTLLYMLSSEIDLLFIAGTHRMDFNGWIFYEQLRSNSKLSDIPIIVYTPWFASNSAPNPTDYGDTLFTMPMDLREFIKKVRELTNNL